MIYEILHNIEKNIICIIKCPKEKKKKESSRCSTWKLYCKEKSLRGKIISDWYLEGMWVRYGVGKRCNLVEKVLLSPIDIGGKALDLYTVIDWTYHVYKKLEFSGSLCSSFKDN